MIRSFVIDNKNDYQPGKVVKSLDSTPSPQQYDKYKIIKLLHLTRLSSHHDVGEFQVEPINTPKDADNLVGWHR